MSMPFVLVETGIFSGNDRDESENFVLWMLEVLTERNRTYLLQYPKTPKLYDSGVVYSVPEQMSEGRLDASKINELLKCLTKLKVNEETVKIITHFLHGIEIFRDIPTLYKRGHGDCDNIASARAAELRLAGIKASPYITWRERWNGTTYHALVRWPDGTSEDPSLLLGMGGEAKIAARAEEIRKNKERFDTYVETARQLCGTGVMDIKTAGKTIDAMGLLPQSKKW